MKKVFVAVLSLLILFGWYVTIWGVGFIAPLKDQIKLGLDLSGGVYVVMEAQTDATGDDLKNIMVQTQAVIEKRVNQLGLSEPIVTIEGKNRIRVELPGAENAKEAIDAIGQTAQLQFELADGTPVLNGSHIKTSGVTRDQESSGYAISLKFTDEGAKLFEKATETIVRGQVVSRDPATISPRALVITLDGEILSAPLVNQAFHTSDALITGGPTGFSDKEALQTSALIRGGALPTELVEVETSVTGPTLGINSLQMSLLAGIIGVALIFIVMLVMYRIMGVAANIALLLYVLIMFWTIVFMKGVLTLPGIAGIILSIGMALDANVIIFSRVQEELRAGKSVRVAVSSGFHRAMATVIDAQVTTIIAGIVLYQLGSGPVKGFAMTLMIGIFASIITAVIVTQMYLSLMSESKVLGKKQYFGIKEGVHHV